MGSSSQESIKRTPKMSDCSEYDAKIESGRVAKYDYDTAAAGAKSCAGNVAAPDLTQYVWDYKNDENKNLGLEVGAVVHNREWSYGLIKYASLVQVGISFKAKCTFSFKDEGCMRTLKIVDDTGYVHGELDLNIRAGTPCVCAVPKKEKIRVKDKGPGHCGGEAMIIKAPMAPAGGYVSREWNIREIEDAHRVEHRALVDKYWNENPTFGRQQIEEYALDLATKNNWNNGIYGD